MGAQESAPRINDLNAQTVKVSDVSGDNCKFVHQCSSRDQPIGYFQRPAF